MFVGVGNPAAPPTWVGSKPLLKKRKKRSGETVCTGAHTRSRTNRPRLEHRAHPAAVARQNATLRLALARWDRAPRPSPPPSPPSPSPSCLRPSSSPSSCRCASAASGIAPPLCSAHDARADPDEEEVKQRLQNYATNLLGEAVRTTERTICAARCKETQKVPLKS